MGTFSYPITLVGPSGDTTVDALVDTGATYTVLPAEIVARLGIKSLDKAPFELGDGRVVEYEVGAIDARIDGQQRQTLCVFAGAGAQPLIGAYTVEAFLLAVDPVGKRLVPTRGYIL